MTLIDLRRTCSGIIIKHNISSVNADFEEYTAGPGTYFLTNKYIGRDISNVSRPVVRHFVYSTPSPSMSCMMHPIGPVSA